MPKRCSSTLLTSYDGTVTQPEGGSDLWPLDGSDLWPELQQLMQDAIRRHGDRARWQQALDALDAIDEKLKPPYSRPKVGDLPVEAAPSEIAPVGIRGVLSEDHQKALDQALAALHPWRKGPWCVFNTHLDTEWRSDWKWQRLQPFLPDLTGQRILDVGCGNGYYGWQMLNAGASDVVGIDPTIVFVFQHAAMKRLIGPLYPNARHRVLPLKLEDLPQPGAEPAQPVFDSVFSMGVLYHRKNHMAHLQELQAQLRRGGTLVLETLVCESEDLRPTGRYARMRNVHLLPQPETVAGWLDALGFENCEVRNLNRTLSAEQRSTPWMTFESLKDALDPANPEQTIEGYPSPVRALFVANLPA